MSKTAIYPGTFDPITNGHIDIIERGLAIFDRLIIAVALNPKKAPLFNIEERIEMIEESLGRHPKVSVETFSGLLVEEAERRKARVILRGLRAVSDFEYEFQMALMNRNLNDKIETVFMMTGEAYSYLSSSVVKEIASLGGTVDGLVPNIVSARLKETFAGTNLTNEGVFPA
ncbi:MAG: Phosphopantetheine adenylyltransferase [Deltaproteobacteria bacterium]|nr:Phosphopantetheine adenylyltransferase [Deltaproteobacteria bacterium]MBM2839204.1 Phosphopantetheine adenylyltransferase [Deltaproteobacteria bacterium]